VGKTGNLVSASLGRGYREQHDLQATHHTLIISESARRRSENSQGQRFWLEVRILSGRKRRGRTTKNQSHM
jgi:hypothetical protein